MRCYPGDKPLRIIFRGDTWEVACNDDHDRPHWVKGPRGRDCHFVTPTSASAVPEPTPPRPGPPVAPCRMSARGVPSLARRPHPTSPVPCPDPVAPASANDCSGPQTPQRPPERFQQVPRVDVGSSLCSPKGPTTPSAAKAACRDRKALQGAMCRIIRYGCTAYL